MCQQILDEEMPKKRGSEQTVQSIGETQECKSVKVKLMHRLDKMCSVAVA